MSVGFYIAEEEFLSIAEALKPYTEDRMKIEPFPWFKENFIDNGRTLHKANIRET